MIMCDECACHARVRAHKTRRRTSLIREGHLEAVMFTISLNADGWQSGLSGSDGASRRHPRPDSGSSMSCFNCRVERECASVGRKQNPPS